MRRNLSAHVTQCAIVFQSIVTFPNFSAIVAAGVTNKFSVPERLHVPLNNEGTDNQSSLTFRTVQVQIVHRHGDRTPITPLRDEKYWESTLVPDDILAKISNNTKIIRRRGGNNHKAIGRGPFGKLTQMGLLQMVELGSKLRNELNSDDENEYNVWNPKLPLHPKNIKVISTDFPRTIQSVQGLLVGLFPDGTDEPIIIDAQNTNTMIPDPQPRLSVEQEALELELISRPHIVSREEKMFPIAARTTKALKNLLGKGSSQISFGVGEEKTSQDETEEVLAWAQLAEITKCLRVRNLLPDTISHEDQEALSEYTAWRWFQSLRHPRLAFLAMNTMATKIVKTMIDRKVEPPVTIYSAHDSTLIGLLCAFRLEHPSAWPEYGSYLKIELIEVSGKNMETNYVVRFLLNGNMLRSNWDKPVETVSLDLLWDKIKTEGAEVPQ